MTQPQLIQSQSQSQPTSHLPIIDLSSNSSEISKQILQAATNDGFLYLRLHGLPLQAEVIDELFDLSRRFFDLESEEKAGYKIQANDRGWSAPFDERLDENLEDEPGDYKEAFNIGEFQDGKASQPLPAVLSAQQALLDSFQNKTRQICLLLLEHIARALEIPEDVGGNRFFSSRHEQANGATASILRLIRYPALRDGTANSAEVRCGAHTDFGSMTLLFQRPGQPGLEVERKQEQSKTSTWLPVAVSPAGTESDPCPPIVVNIGDMLQSWTRGALRSTKHRVVIPTSREGDRYSIAYFCHPAGDTKLVGVPSKIVQENGDLEGETEIITAAEHLKRKLDKAYGRE